MKLYKGSPIRSVQKKRKREDPFTQEQIQEMKLK